MAFCVGLFKVALSHSDTAVQSPLFGQQAGVLRALLRYSFVASPICDRVNLYGSVAVDFSRLDTPSSRTRARWHGGGGRRSARSAGAAAVTRRRSSLSGEQNWLRGRMPAPEQKSSSMPWTSTDICCELDPGLHVLAQG